MMYMAAFQECLQVEGEKCILHSIWLFIQPNQSLWYRRFLLDPERLNYQLLLNLQHGHIITSTISFVPVQPKFDLRFSVHFCLAYEHSDTRPVSLSGPSALVRRF